jgi:ABC-type tungstate transport system permease subunit/ABC-type tungstate transport system substrate-binding protein
MDKIKIILSIIFLNFIVVPHVSAKENILRLAITTTTENSGLMSRLNPIFEEQYNAKLDVVVVGSGQAFRLGENGDVDVILVHAPEAEKKFIETGGGVLRTAVMHNKFVLLGPTDDPLRIKNTTSIIEAIALIKDHNELFVSRGDESGTHKKEQKLWQLANIHEFGSAYRASGQGMGATLLLSNELHAYTLSDRGTFLAMQDKLELSVVHEGDTILHNPYHVIAVNPAKHPHINIELAKQYIEFITSEKVQRLIGEYQINQQQLFHPMMEIVAEGQAVPNEKVKRRFFTDAINKSFSLVFHFDKELFLVVWTSLIISLIAVLIASLIAIPLGILVALKLFPGRSFLMSILNTLMALPTVIVGLLLYGLLNRQGLLGEFGLLYTPAAIVLGQSILIIPIIWNLSIAAVNGADPRLRSTCLSLGANLYQQGLIYINEVRFALMAAVVAGFGRAIGEVGVAMMLGGNIAGFTRTMTTAIALETSKGEFEFALALGMMLLLVALVVNIVLQQFQELKQ